MLFISLIKTCHGACQLQYQCACMCGSNIYVAVAVAELRCHAALAAHSMPRRHASFTQQPILTTTTIITLYWYKDSLFIVMYAQGCLLQR